MSEKKSGTTVTTSAIINLLTPSGLNTIVFPDRYTKFLILSEAINALAHKRLIIYGDFEGQFSRVLPDYIKRKAAGNLMVFRQRGRNLLKGIVQFSDIASRGVCLLVLDSIPALYELIVPESEREYTVDYGSLNRILAIYLALLKSQVKAHGGYLIAVSYLSPEPREKSTKIIGGRMLASLSESIIELRRTKETVTVAVIKPESRGRPAHFVLDMEPILWPKQPMTTLPSTFN